MEQKLVYLHTSKQLSETEEILKNQGMQILFKSEDAEIKFSDMTEEEKSSWLKSMEADIQRQIVDLAVYRTAHNKYKKIIEKKFEEILKLVRNGGIYNVDEKFGKLVEDMQTIDQYFYGMKDWRDCVVIDHHTYSQAKIRCSCLIAKQGTSLVRYLSYLNDPILSFIGSNANNLKLSLEKKF